MAHGNQRCRRLGCRHHAAFGGKAVNIRSILVADEHRAVGEADDCLIVQGYLAIDGLRQHGKIPGSGANIGLRVEAGCIGALIIHQQQRVGECSLDAALLLVGGRCCAGRHRREPDRQHVEAGAVVGCTRHIVTAVGQEQHRALVAVAIAAPVGRVHRHARAGTEGFTEFVALIGRNSSNADQPLVDERCAADRNRIIGKGCGRKYGHGGCKQPQQD